MASNGGNGRAVLSMRPWTIALAEESQLKLHEQSIPSLTARLAEEIKSSGRIYHPVVADAKTGLVVDGTHRVEAVRKLGLQLIPVYGVDYLSDRIVVEGWVRAVRRNVDPETVLRLAEQLGFKPSTEDVEDFAIAFTWRNGVSALFVKDDGGLRSVYEALSNLEAHLHEYEVSYMPESELKTALSSGDYALCYRLRKISKKEVMSLVRSGFRLPPKSTRHIVDRRPLFLLCPLEIIMDKDAERLFSEWLEKGLWLEIPKGIVLDRRYDERTVVYYREDLREYYPENLLKTLKA